MNGMILSIGLAYLIGLGVLGYGCLLVAVQLLGKKRNWPNWLIAPIVGCHFLLGIVAIVFVPTTFFRSRQDVTESDAITFAIVCFTMLVMAFLVAKAWNKLQHEKNLHNQ